MFKRPGTLLVLTVTLIFSSCKPSETELPDAVGNPGTLVIVGSDDVHKTLSPLYDTLFLQPGSSHPPFFEVLKSGISDFQHFYFNQRTILVLVTEDMLEEMKDLLKPFDDQKVRNMISSKVPEQKMKHDFFARYQHIVYLFGKDASDLGKKLGASRSELARMLESFSKVDLHRQITADTTGNSQYTEQMKKDFGVGIMIPAGFSLKTRGQNTYLFQMDKQEGSSQRSIGLVMHAYPYKDSSDFSYFAIRSARDTVSKYLVKGELGGTYMSTSESDFYPAITKEIMKLNGRKCVKVSGWWTIKGMSMAGPYVRYVVHVPEKNLLFAFEGFVYRPELQTREPETRLIEAIALGIN